MRVKYHLRMWVWMIIEDVRIKEKEATIGHQHEESYIKYYDVQVSVFGNWWLMDRKPEDKMDLDKAIAFRDLIRDIIREKS